MIGDKLTQRKLSGEARGVGPGREGEHLGSCSFISSEMPWLYVQDVACHQSWRRRCPAGAELRGLSQGFGRSVAARLGWLLRSCRKRVCHQAGGKPLGLTAAREGACISCISTGKLTLSIGFHSSTKLTVQLDGEHSLQHVPTSDPR